ncbi:MAG: class II glutamine amidotransferase [Lachnospiraceae bacterium]|nr:class II glutamine amidotransferase [Lachnospiraceae bacterium]
MCELFGVCARQPVECRDDLKEFYRHSCRHPNGWGLAILDGNSAVIEKEPLEADKSSYLHERLTVPVEGKLILAHIRYATIGNVEYKNCHPFSGVDCTGRRWTLIHNGTIFEYDPLNRYVERQVGDTDSERIFLFLLDEVNRRMRSEGKLDAEKRFQLLDELVADMAKGNKLNLIISDGEYMYVHTNYENSLCFRKQKSQVFFSTEPLGRDLWEPVPMTTLLAWRNGELVYTGTNHGQVFEDNEENMKFLYQIFSSL